MNEVPDADQIHDILREVEAAICSELDSFNWGMLIQDLQDINLEGFSTNIHIGVFPYIGINVSVIYCPQIRLNIKSC